MARLSNKITAGLVKAFLTGYLSYERISQLLHEQGIDVSPIDVRNTFITFALMRGYSESDVFPFLTLSPKDVLAIENSVGTKVKTSALQRKYKLSRYEIETLIKGEFSMPMDYTIPKEALFNAGVRSPKKVTPPKTESSLSEEINSLASSHKNEVDSFNGFTIGNGFTIEPPPMKKEFVLFTSTEKALADMGLRLTAKNIAKFENAKDILDKLTHEFNVWTDNTVSPTKGRKGAFTDNQVRLIRKAHDSGVSTRLLAYFFDSFNSAITRIVSGETYSHVDNFIKG